MHTVFALLCFVVVIHWLIFPYPSGLLQWHCGNLTIAPVPAKQPWWIWINTSCEFIMNDCITTTKQSTTKPCAYFLGYTVRSCNFVIACGFIGLMIMKVNFQRIRVYHKAWEKTFNRMIGKRHYLNDATDWYIVRSRRPLINHDSFFRHDTSSISLFKMVQWSVGQHRSEIKYTSVPFCLKWTLFTRVFSCTFLINSSTGHSKINTMVGVEDKSQYITC